MLTIVRSLTPLIAATKRRGLDGAFWARWASQDVPALSHPAPAPDYYTRLERRDTADPARISPPCARPIRGRTLGPKAPPDLCGMR